MKTRPEERIWERAQAGEHTAVIGFYPRPPAPPMRAIRVACDAPQSTLGPIVEAKRKLDAVLGKDTDFMNHARDLVFTGLRRRFLGEVPERGPSTAALVDVCHRIAATGNEYALVFDAVDGADEPTLAMLERLAKRPSGLALPLVFVFRAEDLGGAAQALLTTVRETHGDDAVIAAESADETTEVAPEASVDIDIRSLPPDVRQVLRAGAVIGSGFEADLLAELLECSQFEVLDCLQLAADAGVPIDDRGEERFFLPDSFVEKLLASTLPSLQAAWHRRLGWLLTAAEPLAPVVGPESAAESEPWVLRSPRDRAKTVDDSFSGPLDDLGIGAVPIHRADPGETVVMPVQETDGNDERTIAIAQPTPEITVVMAQPDADGNDERTIAIPQPEDEGAEAGTEAKAGTGSEPGTEAEAEPASSVEADSQADRDVVTRSRPSIDLFANMFASPDGVEEAIPMAMPESADADAHAQITESPRPIVRKSGRISPPTRREIPIVTMETLQSLGAAGPGAGVTAGDEGKRPTGPAPAKAGRAWDDSSAAATARDLEPEPSGLVVEVPRADSRATRDPARAASHLSAAGQIEAAARKYAAAAGEASALGAYEQAMAHGRKALRTIESLPTTPERRRFRAQLLVALARLQWQAAGLLDGHPDPAFTLDSALETADLAMASIADEDPAELIAEAREVAAGICYDMGTKHALERALDELTRSARLFLSEGQTLQAARLLNDQAAVYVRLGDPVRATHLLSESQKIFEHRAANDPMAIRELAETHHLLARLPLHAAIRPGREADAYELALAHASEAEGRYRHLGAIREIARVWETMGRLELAAGNLDTASERLEAALEVQSQTGDLTGLARSTGALSDVFAAQERLTDALAVLGDSITLNTEKGSPIGLAFNRRALTQLVARVADNEDPGAEFKEMSEVIRDQLDAAENQLGRVTLPPEPGI